MDQRWPEVRGRGGGWPQRGEAGSLELMADGPVSCSRGGGGGGGGGNTVYTCDKIAWKHTHTHTHTRSAHNWEKRTKLRGLYQH